jgi:RNA-directed DNA polymerase
MASKRILDLNNIKARDFLKETNSYINFDIPFYFDFTDLLSVASGLTYRKSLESLYRKRDSHNLDNPKYYEGVNHIVLSNKDGAFSWRPLELIHPILYVDLVNAITEAKNWSFILGRFKKFSKGYVECISIPRISPSLRAESHKASQVRHWWEEIEQRSIRMALNYNYVFSTDITNCYGSIYTHSIEWALTEGGRDTVKATMRSRRGNRSQKSLGHRIDQKLRNMNYGQTNGIPQGSVLMDFIAEIVLGYGDMELTKALQAKSISKKNFHILRYRDDYRIFVNNPVIGHQILKELNNVLYNLGMKMNPTKTSENNDLISASIKKEKMEIISIAPVSQSFQKEALRIYHLSKKYPNSGLVNKELSLYFDKISSKKFIREKKNLDIEVLVAIFSMIAFTSPGTINWTAAIISLLISEIKSVAKKGALIRSIHKKFDAIPNAGLVDLWLQRISTVLNININYQDKLTKAAFSKIKTSDIWECSWLERASTKTLDAIGISSLNSKLNADEIPVVISRKEVELFKLRYD